MYPGPRGTAGGLVVGGLAATGGHLAWWLAAGLALVVGGILLVRAVRRRSRAGRR